MPYASKAKEKQRNQRYYKKNRISILEKQRAIKEDPIRKKYYGIKYSFGLGRLEYDALVLTSCNSCWACGTIPEEGGTGKTLNVDHDHETGKVRGLLCHTCNLLLGWIEKNPERRNQIDRYLEEVK